MYLLKDTVLLFWIESQVSVKQAMFAFNRFSVHSVSSILFEMDCIFAKKMIGSCFLIAVLMFQTGPIFLFSFKW